MLDKDPNTRINIDDIDKEIRKINFEKIYNGKNTKNGLLVSFISIK
jgi:hypothetical protein